MVRFTTAACALALFATVIPAEGAKKAKGSKAKGEAKNATPKEAQGRVTFEGLNLNEEERNEFSKQAEVTQEAMQNRIRTNRKAREEFECDACMAAAREILPGLIQTRQDMKDMARSWDYLASMEKVCEDNGPNYGVQIFKHAGKKDGVREFSVVQPHNMRLFKSGEVDGVMKGDWVVRTVNEVCSVLVNDHYEAVGEQTTFRDIVKVGCKEGAGYCKRQDYLRFLTTAEKDTIDQEAIPHIPKLVEKINKGDKKTLEALKCNSCHAVARELEGRMDAHIAKTAAAERSKEKESEYLQKLESFCAVKIWSDYGFMYNWLEQRTEPHFVKSIGIKVPSEDVPKILARACDDIVNDHYEKFLPWGAVYTAASKKKTPAAKLVCPSFCKAGQLEKDEL